MRFQPAGKRVGGSATIIENGRTPDKVRIAPMEPSAFGPVFHARRAAPPWYPAPAAFD